ncbi:MAG: gluconokinase [Chthoniobacterales bacterium]
MPRGKSEVLVLALDIGSSSTRSAVFAGTGKHLRGTNAAQQYAVQYGADGTAELDPQKLCRAVRRSVQETVGRRGRNARIGAVSISAFWHGLLGLDAARRPVTPIYMWSDARAAVDAQQLRDRFDERAVHARTGCMLRAAFWPAKLRWLRRTEPGLFRRVKYWVSPADWIAAQLFGATGCSLSMASATGLFDSLQQRWDAELCDACAIRGHTLEDVRTVAAVVGRGRRPRLQMNADAQIFTAIGDGAASNLGSAVGRGLFAINVGTSAAVRTVCQPGAQVSLGLFRYLLDEHREVVGGAVSNAGNLRRWCLRELRVDDRTASHLNRAQRVEIASSNLDVLPFWVAERAPTWPDNIRGTVTGLKQTTTAVEIDRAAQCSVFYRLAQILELTENVTESARAVIVSGGILRTPGWLPLLADAIGRDITVASDAEASLRGAAIYALQKLGFTPGPLPSGRIVEHDRALARLHRARRTRQEALERNFSQLR